MNRRSLPSSAKQTTKILTAANQVTLIRLLGVPLFALLTLYYVESVQQGSPVQPLRYGALAWFLLMAVTDALDGYLARSRGEVTRLGRILDPLADKALLMTAVLMLTRPSLPELRPQLPVYVAAAVVSRDLLLLVGAVVVHHLTGTLHVRPRWIGKVATFLLMWCIAWVLAGGPEGPLRVLSAIATTCVVVSGLLYLWDGLRDIERGENRPG